jgi:hypothetical protein
LKSIFVIFLLNLFIVNAFSQNEYSVLNKESFLLEEFRFQENNDSALFYAQPILKREWCNGCDSGYIKENFLNRSLIHTRSNWLEINPILQSIHYFDLVSQDNYSHNAGGLSCNIRPAKSLFMHASFSGNYVSFPDSVDSEIDHKKVIPGFGRVYQKKGNFYLFPSAMGYISYSPSQFINFQIGRDKHFWGNGFRSLWLSDNSNAFPFGKATVSVWKIKYVMLYASFRDVDVDSGTLDLQEKYSSLHSLSWKVFPRFDLEIFEAVVWRGRDSLGYRGFDVNYLNPVIFYRPVDFSMASPDNMIMGAGGKLRIFKSTMLYGQIVLDEFKLSELQAGKGWWANKYGIQAGIKTFRFLDIENWFVQVEVNFIKPFTYSHISSLENYGNYFQALAHPIGANCREIIIHTLYQKGRNMVKLFANYIEYGTDYNNINFGGNIYRSYTDSRNDYGNFVGQGLLNKLAVAELKYAYIINPKWYLRFNIGAKIKVYSGNSSSIDRMYVYAGFSTNLYNTDDWK